MPHAIFLPIFHMIGFASSHSLRSILAGTFFVLCLLVNPSITHADDRYWVLGAGDWNDTGHWSATSGSASGATVPDANDKAHFDGHSGGGVVTVNTAVNVNALHLSSAFSGSIMQTSNTIRVGTGDILVGSGRLIGGNAALSLFGSYTQTGGIVTSQSTLTLSGSMSVTKPGSTTSPAPSFTSTGTVVFEGKIDQNLIRGNGATLNLWNVTLSNTGGSTNDDLIVNMSGGLALSGALSITLGNFDLDTKNQLLSLSGSMTLTSTAQATFVTDANVFMSGSLTVGASALATFSGSMTLTMRGAEPTIDVNNATIPNLTIASSSGTVLADNLQVSGTLQANTGTILALSSYNLSATGATTRNYATIAENTGKISHAVVSFLITDSSYAEVSAVAVGGSFYFQLDESDENISGTAADTVDITVSTSASDSETVTLTETTNTSGIFQGSIATANQTVSAGNGTLDSTNTVGVTATFTDAQDSGTANDSSSLSNPQNSGSSGGGGGSSGGGGGGGGGRRGSVIRVNDSSGSSENNDSLENISNDMAPPSPTMPWSDLNPSHRFADAALRLYEAGIVKGNDNGTVMLDRSISRVEALTLLVRTLGAEVSNGTNLPFSDVDANAWYAAPLRAALDLTIIKGFPDGTFRPGDSLNLVQSLKIISIALGLALQTDEEGMVHWFDPYVAAGREHGLISGSIDRERSVTRGEFFGWLVKLLPQE